MQIIDKNNWIRKSHFDFFSSMDHPVFNICFDVDITATRNYAKKHSFKLFNMILYFTSRAVNEIPELKTRIRGDEIIQHEQINPSFTVLGENNLFNFCYADFNYDINIFFDEVNKNSLKRKTCKNLMVGDPNRDDFIYVTSIPWINFTSVQHPMNTHFKDSVPKLAWGKFIKKENKLIMPYAFQVHHGLADGYHSGLFYEIFQEMLNKPESYISFN
jgi:chloramphenicol O-acetyltransferase type A